jgi:formylglycine-generating enzyme required for sulfatase activity
MKTAVELFDEFIKLKLINPKPFAIYSIQVTIKDYNNFLEQVKEMEKQQIMSAWHNGLANQTEFFNDHTGTIIKANCAEQYYNETFKSE